MHGTTNIKKSYFLYCSSLYCGDFPEFAPALGEGVLYNIGSDDWL